jgi:hypothetical protein
MTFLLYLTGLLLIGAIASFVASPLFIPEIAQEPEQLVDLEAPRWEKQKADAYSALKEVEFDLQMGKLTQEDYLVLREKYEARALEALAQLDRLTGASGQRPGEGIVTTSSAS